MSQHARNAVGCRGDETFEGFGGFSNNPRARRARKTKNATGHLGLFSTAVGRDTVTDAGWFSDEDLGRDLVSSRDAPRVSHAIITPSLYFSPSTVVPVTYGVLRIAGRRGKGVSTEALGNASVEISNLGCSGRRVQSHRRDPGSSGRACRGGRTHEATRRVSPVGPHAATRRKPHSGGWGTHCVCVIGPGATLKGRPWPFAPTCAVGPLWLAYCASYAGSTPAGTTPGPMDGLCETRTGIIAPIRCDARGALSVVARARRTSTFDRAGETCHHSQRKSDESASVRGGAENQQGKAVAGQSWRARSGRGGRRIRPWASARKRSGRTLPPRDGR